MSCLGYFLGGLYCGVGLAITFWGFAEWWQAEHRRQAEHLDKEVKK